MPRPGAWCTGPGRRRSRRGRSPRAPRPAAGSRRSALARSITFPTGALYGERWIEIGTGTLIGAQVTMCAGMVPGQYLGEAPVLRVGDHCVIGRGSHIIGHQSIDIGDDVFTGPYVYITDQNHGYSDPDVPIGRQWPSNTAVSVGPGSWLGAGVIVLPGARIGRNVVVAAGSVVRGEVPDRCVVAGVPRRSSGSTWPAMAGHGLRRYRANVPERLASRHESVTMGTARVLRTPLLWPVPALRASRTWASPGWPGLGSRAWTAERARGRTHRPRRKRGLPA